MVWSGTWVAERLGVELVGGRELRDLMGLALRRNPKRAHLLVSNVLGKHVPQSPRVVYGTGFGLGKRVSDLLGPDVERAVVLGYAETATGLGHAVADGMGRSPYLHSTRRPVAGVARAGGFEESHSHATSHLLLPEDPGLFTGDGPLVLVDDEFSTGNTVLNTIRDLHERYPRTRYVVVALVDMRSAADHGRLAEFARDIGARVDLVTLASGTVRLPDGVLEKGRRLVAEQEALTSALAAPAPASAPTPVPTPHEEDSGSGAGGVAGAHAVRVPLDWPAGVPDGGRHGFTPAHRIRLESSLPAMAAAVAAELGAARRVLILGFEELMYAPLRLAEALERTVEAEVRYSTTTRSPVLAVDDPGYAIRSRLVFPAHDTAAFPDGDGIGDRYAYNVAGAGFDAVVAVIDSVADSSELHAPDGLLAQLAAHIPRVLVTVIPSYVPSSSSLPGPSHHSERQEPPMLPEPLRGPAFSSYAPDDVGWLLQDMSDVELEAPTEEREEAVQNGGAHYAESLPVEYQPSAQYQELFKSALDASAARIARAVGTVTETVLAERSPRPVLVSLARAGTPVGVLMRRWAQRRHGLDLPHYAVSIVRGRGIDANALRWLAAHHDPADVVFVDGWTGKGAITRELAEALTEFGGFNPEIAVLADPGGCVRTYGTREDFLIPSACLNSTVSGLISRTVLRADLVGPHDFHGAKYYRELAGTDVSAYFLDTVAARFDEVAEAVEGEVKEMLTADRAPTWAGWAAVERISEEYGIHDVNLVKPGVGETTRVLLRRVPWKILAQRGAGTDLDHVRLLAEQRGVPVEEVDGLPYTSVGLIHPQYTRGATGATGKAVTAK
ncbi:phosphoribosyltransferase [Streptomyces sp. AK02-01A]|uniref:phosphoribosyltransferase n=1 Tax=Streptomyces sp. AK02-01A TaxID=3028648 RepID=UPI0029A62AC3|nr:phosphoribosyltransferase [Streptomyces sp. AK02-01A]MDX3849658.1 phosphoribosyltransferase [Streptomyces sp. AK02-01A]MDX3849772.1 phosphoribosyltransferase [Streptomyces sp. AK02-01A]